MMAINTQLPKACSQKGSQMSLCGCCPGGFVLHTREWLSSTFPATSTFQTPGDTVALKVTFAKVWVVYSCLTAGYRERGGEYSTASLAQALLSTGCCRRPLHFAQAEVLHGNWPSSQVQKSWALKGGWSLPLPPKYFLSVWRRAAWGTSPVFWKNVSVKLKSAAIANTDSDLVLC